MKLKYVTIFIFILIILMSVHITYGTDYKSMFNNNHIHLISAGEELVNNIGCYMCHPKNYDDVRGIAPYFPGISDRMTPDDLMSWLNDHLYSEPRLSMFDGESGPTFKEKLSIGCYLWSL